MATAAAIEGGPWWRSVLEARWRDRLHEVTELSLAFHDAAASAPERQLGQPSAAVRQLMDRAVAARRSLADVDEALARLATGSFGQCESCAAVIPLPALRQLPEERYCSSCACAAAPGSASRG